MSNNEKADLIKVLSLNGQFAEIEATYGAKAALKGKEYVMTKLVALKAKMNSGEDIIQQKTATEFVMFAIAFDEPQDMDQIEMSFNARNSSKPLSNSIILNEELNQVEDVDEICTQLQGTADLELDATAAEGGETDELISDAAPLTKRSGFQMPVTQGVVAIKKTVTASGYNQSKFSNSNVSLSKIAKKGLKTGLVNQNKVKAVKDPNAPKRPLNAYMLFGASNRSSVIAENPSMKPPEIIKELGLLWGRAQNDEKEPFLESARIEKEAYEIEMRDYRRLNPEEKHQQKTHKKVTSRMITPDGSRRHQKDSDDDDTVDMANDSNDDSSSEDDETNKAPLKGSPDPYSQRSNKRKLPFQPKHQKIKKFGLQTPSAASKRFKVMPSSSHKTEVVQPKVEYIDPVAAAKNAAKTVQSLKGIKESDLPKSENIKQIRTKPKTKCSFPPDFIPAEGDKVVLILESYREFVSELAVNLLTSEDLQDIQVICSSEDAIAHATVTHSRPIGNFDEEVEDVRIVTKDLQTIGQKTAQILSLNIGRETLAILYVPFSSPLLQTEIYLLDRTTYTKSLGSSWLIPNAQIRRLMAANGGKGGEWQEGSIYDVRSDMKANPFASVSVVWMEQEMKPETWFYSYDQLDNLCSPWDLELSKYVLPENVRPTVLPDSLRGSRVTAKAVLTYLKSYDFSSVFMYNLASNGEFCEMFPNTADRLDLHVIKNRCKSGHYDGKSGLSKFFEELQLMCRNGKLFNNSNRGFQPWILADMMEKKILHLQQLLAPTSNEASDDNIYNPQEDNEGVGDDYDSPQEHNEKVDLQGDLELEEV